MERLTIVYKAMASTAMNSLALILAVSLWQAHAQVNQPPRVPTAIDYYNQVWVNPWRQYLQNMNEYNAWVATQYYTGAQANNNLMHNYWNNMQNAGMTGFIGYPQQPATGTQQPGNNPQQPGTNPQQPGTNPQQPGTNPQQPATDPQQPGTNPQQPATDPQQPGTNPQQPATDPQQPGTNPQQPATDTQPPVTGGNQ